MAKTKRFEGLIDRMNEYFLVCDSFNEGKKDIVKPYTMSGLLSYCGISRGEFEALSQNKRYTKAVGSAVGRIEAFIEENMLTGALSCNASLNSLKYNFGWGERRTEDEEKAGNITVTLSPEMRELAM